LRLRRHGQPLDDCADIFTGKIARQLWSITPPTDWGELVQIHDDRDVFQASPNELPAIDAYQPEDRYRSAIDRAILDSH
jgi:hypothetical protein